MRRFALVLGLLCTDAPAVTPPPTTANRPNVLVILADDLGWADVSYHGGADLATPHLDTLARSGLIFTRAFANSSVCSPTRASLLTGRLSAATGVQGIVRDDQPLNTWGWWNPAVPCLVQDFRDQGYATALIGKWHLGTTPDNLPNARGFAHFKGFLGGMMDDYHTHLRRGRNLLRENDRTITATGHATDLFTDWAIEFLRQHAGSLRPDPFFLYLAYTAPHVPLQPPADWLDRVRAREPDLDPTRAAYVALVEHLDDGIGRVVATLRDLDLERNTILLFTSDNGGMVKDGARNGPHRDGKGSMYEGGLRVPGFIVWPDQLPPGQSCSQVATTMDLLPTLLELCGLHTAARLDGRSLAPCLRGTAPPPRREALFFSRRSGRFNGGALTFAVRRDDWKLLQNNPYGPLEMYDLAADPAESRDLLGGTSGPPADPALDATYRQLFLDLLSFQQQAGRVPFLSPNSALAPP